MAQTDPDTLVKFLLRGTSRTRVGLWRFPQKKIGKEGELAINLGVQAIDVSRYYYDRLPQGADHVRLDVSKVLGALDAIATSAGTSRCALIYNLDLLLAALREEERQQIWQSLFNSFPNRPRALIVAISETAHHLLPSEDLLGKWQEESRLV